MRFRDVKALWEWALFSKIIMYFNGFLRMIIWGLKGKYLAYHSDIRWGKVKKDNFLHEKEEGFYFIRSTANSLFYLVWTVTKLESLIL